MSKILLFTIGFYGLLWNSAVTVGDELPAIEEPLLSLFAGLFIDARLEQMAWESIVSNKRTTINCAQDHVATLEKNVLETAWPNIGREVVEFMTEVAKLRGDNEEEMDSDTAPIEEAMWERVSQSPELLKEMEVILGAKTVQEKGEDIESMFDELYLQIEYTVFQMIFLKTVVDVAEKRNPTYEEWSRTTLPVSLHPDRVEGTSALEIELWLEFAKEEFPFLLCAVEEESRRSGG